MQKDNNPKPPRLRDRSAWEMEQELVIHDCSDLQLPYCSRSRDGSQSPRNMLWKEIESQKHALLKGNGQMFWLSTLGSWVRKHHCLYRKLESCILTRLQATRPCTGDPSSIRRCTHTRPHPRPGNTRTPEWQWDSSLQQQVNPMSTCIQHTWSCPHQAVGNHRSPSFPGDIGFPKLILQPSYCFPFNIFLIIPIAATYMTITLCMHNTHCL